MSEDTKEVYERGGVGVTINPRDLTAEEMVRFAHDPRVRQIAMFEDDRFEARQAVLDDYPDLAGMYKADDGNCQVFALENAHATISSFAGEPRELTF